MLVTSVSFFNEVSTETQNYPHSWFHFLTSLKEENHAQSWFHFLMSLKSETMLISLLDHGFQEDKALEGHHVKGQTSVMASKRSSLDGRNTLWKEHMSKVAIGVRRSGSNSPTEEITMSTTGSKS
jgi:hypothetical protein